MTQFRLDAMGVETSTNEVTLDPAAGIAYAQATNDPVPAHLNGTFIPPIYAVVPVWEKVFEVVTGVVPEEHFFSIVHGEQDMIFHQPLKASMTLVSYALGESISVKASGTTLVVKAMSIDGETKAPVVEQYFTMFFRGVDGGENYGEPHKNGLNVESYSEIAAGNQPVVSLEAHIDDDQTFRYADASGDRMPIHLDADFAKSVGLPGIIVHGLCTMAHASWAAISQLCNNDPERLARMSVRFSKPLLPGDDLTTNFYPAAGALEGSTNSDFVFISVRSGDNTPILTNAFVQVRG